MLPVGSIGSQVLGSSFLGLWGWGGFGIRVNRVLWIKVLLSFGLWFSLKRDDWTVYLYRHTLVGALGIRIYRVLGFRVFLFWPLGFGAQEVGLWVIEFSFFWSLGCGAFLNSGLQGLRVQDVRLFWSLGFGAQELGFIGSQGLGFSCFGLWVWGLGIRVFMGSQGLASFCFLSLGFGALGRNVYGVGGFRVLGFRI